MRKFNLVPFVDFCFYFLSFSRWNQGFPGGASGKETTCQCRRHKRRGFHPWVGKILWRRKCNPLQYSCLENPRDRGAWWATKSMGLQRVRTETLTFSFWLRFYSLEILSVNTIETNVEWWLSGAGVTGNGEFLFNVGRACFSRWKELWRWMMVVSLHYECI